MPRDGVPGARSGPRPWALRSGPPRRYPSSRSTFIGAFQVEGCLCGTIPESREPSFQTSLQWMRTQPGGTTEALATRLSFRYQLAGGLHHPQAWVARLVGVLAVAVIDAPAG